MPPFLLIRSGRNSLTALFLLTFSVLSQAQYPVTGQMSPWQFVHLTKADGLASDWVLDMVQDDDGFWWLATNNGLQRFDGKHFTTFRHDPDNRNSLLSDRVDALFTDGQNRLWISTSLGICRLDMTTGVFSRVPCSSGKMEAHVPSRFMRDSRGELWFANTTVGGLYKYNPVTDSWEGMVNTARVRFSGKLCEDRTTGNIWCTLINGLGYYERSSGKFINSFEHPGTHPLFQYADRVTSVMTGQDNRLLVTNHQQREPGICMRSFDFSTGAMSLIANDLKGDNDVVLQDGVGKLWRFSDYWEQFNVFDFTNRKRCIYYNTPGEAGTPVIKFEGIWRVFQDRESSIWLLCNNGIYVFNPEKQKICAHVGVIGADGKVTATNNVMSLFESSGGEIWVGTYFGGTYVYNQEMEMVRHYNFPLSPPGTPDREKNENYNAVWCFQEDREGRIWAGGQLGTMSLFAPDGKLLRQWRPPELDTVTIRSLKLDTEDVLWAGSQRGDFYRQQTRNDNFTQIQFPPSERSLAVVNQIMPSGKDILWIRKGNNLFGCNKVSSQFAVLPNQIQNPGVEMAGLLHWNDSTLLSFGNWLYYFNKNNKTFSRTGKLKELPVRNIFMARPDNRGSVWLGALDGLCRWDTSGSRLVWYNRHDGLPEVEFDEQQTTLQLKDGRMLFSTGLGGFFSFHPDSMSTRVAPPVVSFTAARISGQEVIGFPSIRELEAGYHENMITVTCACPSWLQQPGLCFRYRLIGSSNEWLDNGNNEQLTFSSLPSGRYTLQVQAACPPEQSATVAAR